MEDLKEAVRNLSLEELAKLREEIDRVEAEKRRQKAKKEQERAEFWGELRAVKDLVNSTPLQAAARLQVMEGRALAFGTCETVQVLGLRAFRSKLLNDLPAAESDLLAAWRLVPNCPDGYCRLDLLRRQAKIDIQLHRGPLALEHADACLAGYRAMGESGHDLSGSGIGSALLARGDIRNALGDCVGAAQDLTEALRHFPRTSLAWGIAHRNLAVALLGVGHEEREAAYRMLRDDRYAFRRPAETVEWASFWWIDSQLSVVTGRPKHRALNKLNEVLDVFRGQRMPIHASGVAHDISRIHFPCAGDIKGFLRRLPHVPLPGRTAHLLGQVETLVSLCPPPADIKCRLDLGLRRFRSHLMTLAQLPPCLVLSEDLSK